MHIYVKLHGANHINLEYYLIYRVDKEQDQFMRGKILKWSYYYFVLLQFV